MQKIKVKKRRYLSASFMTARQTPVGDESRAVDSKDTPVCFCPSYLFFNKNNGLFDIIDLKFNNYCIGV